jgi:hypothetical protein
MVVTELTQKSLVDVTLNLKKTGTPQEVRDGLIATASSRES